MKKLSTLDAAAYLCMSRGTLAVWRCNGRGPKFARVGRKVIYEICDLDAFVSSRKVFTTDAMPGREAR